LSDILSHLPSPDASKRSGQGEGEQGREAWEVRVEDKRVRIGDVVAGTARFERWYVDVYIFIYIYHMYIYCIYM
jgi:hypothetical protein